MVDHNILAAKIVGLHIPRGIARWVCDFLVDKRQRVKLSSDCFSEWGTVPSGVPSEGTKLGPCFYLTCIRPVLEYCAPLYHHVLPDYLSKDIEGIQKRALSIISPGLSYDDSPSMFNMASLEDALINIKNCLILLYLIQIISCIIFSLPRANVIITSEDNATLQMQLCVPSVFLAHFCHLCAGVSSCCTKYNLSKV